MDCYDWLVVLSLANMRASLCKFNSDWTTLDLRSLIRINNHDLPTGAPQATTSCTAANRHLPSEE